MRKPFRTRSRNIGSAFFVGFIVVGGAVAFWAGLRAFRAQAHERQVQQVEHEYLSDDVPLVVEMSASATLFSGGSEVGKATRILSDDVATVEVLVSLPPLDAFVSEYHVWLVKDGLADVVDMGPLSLRADGMWEGIFVAGPVTGIIDPALFSRVALMIEPFDENSAPSGNKVAEGVW